MAHRTTVPSIDQPPPEPERLRMTYEQFQDWYTEGRRGEWVDGEVIPFVAPLIVHQRIARFLTELLTNFVEERALGEILRAPVEMRLRDGASYREPDILFVAPINASRVTPRRVDGAADLVVEIVSDDSVQRDRRDKFGEYAVAGVREFWVIDPRPLRLAFVAYALTDEGVFDLIGLDRDGRVHSTVITGLWIDPRWLWQEPLLTAMDALRQILNRPPLELARR